MAPPAGSAGPVAPAATDRLRRDNTALVLRALRDNGSASRAEIAQRTGLAKATVSTIMSALSAAGAVRDVELATVDVEPARAGRTGRPGRPVRLGTVPVALGVEVNVDYLAATALDLVGRTVLSTQVPLRPDDDARASLRALASDSVRALVTDGHRVLGTGVAVPGQVERASGRVVQAPNLGWHDVDLAAELGAGLTSSGAPLEVDNDANCAAAAELAYGAGRGTSDLLYLTGTVGLGAGLVVDGRVQRGAHGLAGEVGHAPLGEPGRRCRCGRTGCWETSVGLPALLRATGVAPDVGARHDPAVRAGVDAVGRSLATGLAVLAATLDPGLIVLGGSFVPLGEWILPVVTDEVSRVSSTQVALSTLGLHAASTGAAAAVLADVYAGTLALA